MFSVIIPLYNKVDYISISINSVLNQTFQEFELIIIDDGSTDNSLDVVKTFQDNRIRIVTQENQGVSSTRNNGVNISKYEYITFLDADDWWDKHFLEEMYFLIQEYPDAILYGSNFLCTKGEEKYFRIKIVDSDKGYINYFKLFFLNKESPIWTSAICIKKQYFLVEKGFKPNLKSGEDLDLWMRLACKYKIAYVNKYLSYYNQDANPKNRAITKIFPKENFYIFNLSEVESYEKTNSFLKKLLDMLRCRSLVQYYCLGLYEEEIAEILKKVDKSNFPMLLRLLYSLPSSIIKIMYLVYKHIKRWRQIIS
jgi:glycosyltransferase involved in cell wall biosynthesis